jgi:hypothetical protein
VFVARSLFEPQRFAPVLRIDFPVNYRQTIQACLQVPEMKEFSSSSRISPAKFCGILAEMI